MICITEPHSNVILAILLMDKTPEYVFDILIRKEIQNISSRYHMNVHCTVHILCHTRDTTQLT